MIYTFTIDAARDPHTGEVMWDLEQWIVEQAYYDDTRPACVPADALKVCGYIKCGKQVVVYTRKVMR
jgi:hypothetical protein